MYILNAIPYSKSAILCYFLAAHESQPMCCDTYDHKALYSTKQEIKMKHPSIDARLLCNGVLQRPQTLTGSVVYAQTSQEGSQGSIPISACDRSAATSLDWKFCPDHSDLH